MLINRMKHILLSRWITKLISQIKFRSLHPLVINEETVLTKNGAVVLNDNDINRMFGWELIKVKNI